MFIHLFWHGDWISVSVHAHQPLCVETVADEVESISLKQGRRNSCVVGRRLDSKSSFPLCYNWKEKCTSGEGNGLLFGEMKTYIQGQTGSLCSLCHVLGARGHSATRPEWSSVKSSLKWFETVLCLFGGYSFNFTWLLWASCLMFIKANLGAITYKLTAPINIQRGSLLALFHTWFRIPCWQHLWDP